MITTHDDFIKMKHFPRYWAFVRGNHQRSFDVFFDVRQNKRRHRTHDDVTVMN